MPTCSPRLAPAAPVAVLAPLDAQVRVDFLALQVRRDAGPAGAGAGQGAAQVKLAGRGQIAKRYPNTELSPEHEAELCVAVGFDDVPR
jgi:hypothetical protein